MILIILVLAFVALAFLVYQIERPNLEDVKRPNLEDSAANQREPSENERMKILWSNFWNTSPKESRASRVVESVVDIDWIGLDGGESFEMRFKDLGTLEHTWISDAIWFVDKDSKLRIHGVLSNPRNDHSGQTISGQFSVKAEQLRGDWSLGWPTDWTVRAYPKDPIDEKIRKKDAQIISKLAGTVWSGITGEEKIDLKFFADESFEFSDWSWGQGKWMVANGIIEMSGVQTGDESKGLPVNATAILVGNQIRGTWNWVGARSNYFFVGDPVPVK